MSRKDSDAIDLYLSEQHKILELSRLKMREFFEQQELEIKRIKESLGYNPSLCMICKKVPLTFHVKFCQQCYAATEPDFFRN